MSLTRGDTVLNYTFLTLYSLVVFGLGLSAYLIAANSIPPAPADLLSIVVIVIFAQKIHILLKKIKRTPPPMGLALMRDASAFLCAKKYVLTAVAAAAGLIWFGDLVPPNIATGFLFFFLNPFSQITTKLVGFFGRLGAELITLGVQSLFVYWVLLAIGSLAGSFVAKFRKMK